MVEMDGFRIYCTIAKSSLRVFDNDRDSVADLSQ